MIRLLRRLFVGLVVLACTAAAEQPKHGTLTIAAAASLASVIDPLATAFTQTRPGGKVRTSLGSSGALVVQIRNGAPFDVLLAADTAFPAALVESGDAEAASQRVYARGILALWTTREAITLPTAELEGIAAVSVRRIAIANPELAPYGAAAREVLQGAGLWERVRERIVLGENAAQAAQFVDTGNADLGLVPLAAVIASGRGRHLRIDSTLHQPLDQAAVLTRRGTTNADARAFMAFLVSPEARALLERAGFAAPPNPPE